MRQSSGRVVGAVLVASLVGVCGLLAQSGRPPTDPAAETYRNLCAGCHGATLSGGRAPTLLDDTWRFGGDDASVAQSILDGRPGTEMAPFRGALTDAEVKRLVAYIRNLSKLAATSAARAQSPAGQTVRSERETFRFEIVAGGLSTPWGLAFLPDGRLLITERAGALRIVDGGRLLPPIAGIPSVFTRQDGGLFDVAIDPAYGRNGWIYLSYAEPGPGDTAMTAIVRGRVKDGRWVDQQTLYRATSPELFSDPELALRLALPLRSRRASLLLDRRSRSRGRCAGPVAPGGQDPSHQPRRHGAARQPVRRPRRRAGRRSGPTGHRNPQGLAFHPVTGKLWATEHGPTGGDELNRIERGHNYGWPLVTSGKMFPARPSPRRRSTRRGLDAPITTWSPSIAPGGITLLHRRPLRRLEASPLRHRSRRRSAAPARDRRRPRRPRGGRSSRVSAASATWSPGPTACSTSR